MATKICAVCGCPYVGASCPNCGSRENETEEIDFDYAAEDDYD